MHGNVGLAKSFLCVLVFSFFGSACKQRHEVAAPHSVQNNSGKAVTDMTWDERRQYFASKLEKTQCNISANQSLDDIVSQISSCLRTHKESIDESVLRKYPDELFIVATAEEAVKAVQSSPREFGIGAVLVEGDKIIERAHNSQIGTKRSDLHAEMTLMTKYEERTKTVREGFNYPSTFKLYSSTEPCPMCYTRIVIAGVTSYYGAPSDEDGMAHLRDNLPNSWAAAARKVVAEPAKSSPKVNAIAEALFYTYARFEIFEKLK